jgi:hypothetical protein
MTESLIESSGEIDQTPNRKSKSPILERVVSFIEEYYDEVPSFNTTPRDNSKLKVN